MSEIENSFGTSATSGDFLEIHHNGVYMHKSLFIAFLRLGGISCEWSQDVPQPMLRVRSSILKQVIKHIYTQIFLTFCKCRFQLGEVVACPSASDVPRIFNISDSRSSLQLSPVAFE